MLCLTVSKWRGDTAIDDFDRYNASVQPGFDVDAFYAGDTRRFLEVVLCFILGCLSDSNLLSV